MSREPNIPLFLWVAAAILTHLTWGGGAEQVAEVFEERADVRRFAESVHQQLRRRAPVEIAFFEESPSEQVERPHEDPDAREGVPDDDSSKPKPPDELTERSKPDPDPVTEPLAPKDRPKDRAE